MQQVPPSLPVCVDDDKRPATSHVNIYTNLYRTRFPRLNWVQYTDNTVAINHNFTLIAAQNADLKAQIAQQTAQITALNAALATNNTATEELRQQLAAARAEIKELSGNISGLSANIQRILAIIPAFTRRVTSYFVQFVAAVKTDTLEALEAPNLIEEVIP